MSVSLSSDGLQAAGAPKAPMAAPAWAVLVIAGVIAASTVSTKMAGLSLFLVLAGGLWLRIRHPAAMPLAPLARHWAWIAVGVLALQGAATLMWQDSWGSRHFEIRLALSALAIGLLLPAWHWLRGNGRG